MPIPQEKIIFCLVGWDGQDAHPTRKNHLCSCGVGRARCPSHKKKSSLFLWGGTGKMPIPQEKIIFVLVGWD
ncbi:hypothetical protein, partial [Microseira wollei]|uniref:hypothetical protein n=1 Tax=Microseira wollei TaxID=467598 RepID=UPI001CFE147B